MLAFNHAQGRFNYRSVAVLLDHDRVLIHQIEGDDFWALPGGRVEFGETSQAAIEREMIEEIGVQVHVERLLWLAENFFTFERINFHEIAHYYLVSLPNDSKLLTWGDRFAGMEGTKRLIFQWLPLEQLESLILYPLFLRHKLLNLPVTVEHIVEVQEVQ